MVNEPKQPIVVSLRREGGRTEIEVAMEASATLPEEMEHAFEPFASVQYEGNGGGIRSAMGLFLCREIARLHGGSLGAKTVSETRRAVVLTLAS
jgi:signal transduction histidine kinase